METYFTMQEDTKLKIQKARVNFKKSPKDRITISYLETRLDTLESYWTLYRETHRVIISEFNSKELMKCNYYTDDAYDVTEELYTDYKTELKDCMLKFKLDSNTVTVSSSNVIESNVGQSFSVKLPMITIPSFSGKYSEWTSFRDLFISLIHSNKALDDVQRLHYLKGYLTGEAEQLLRHIAITANNYQICWDQLEHRYNNKRYLANCILKRFMSQKNIQSESSSAVKELLDTTNECLNALKNLKIDISSWDIIVIYIISLKLDTESRKLWEVQVCKVNDNLPSLNDFIYFLEQRFRSLEFLDNKIPKSISIARTTTKVMHVSSISKCEFCSEIHKLINCKKFAMEEVDARRNFVQTKRLCFNCLGPNHSVFSCRNSTNCRVCRKRHHSLLHPKSFPKGDHNSRDQLDDGADQSPPSSSQSETPNNIVSCFSNVNSQVLLATALVKVEARTGTFVLRSLLDQGSQASFITESSVQLLGLKKIPNKSFISGLGSDQSASLHSKWFVTVKVQSRHDPNFIVVVKAHVLNNITSLLPDRKIVFTELSAQVSDLKLADPSFGTPNKIDILLGAEVYCEILMDGIIKGQPGFPIAQNTKLGWILSGYIHSPNNQRSLKNKLVSMHNHITTDDLLKKFWEIEALSSDYKSLLSEEEQSCEEFFAETVKRDSSGRYIVRLPFKSNNPECQYGNSFEIARKRFYLLEKRLHNNPEFRIQYSDVIEEYLTLGHMEVVPELEKGNYNAIYLPHHAVVKTDRTTTKVRVVFDASCTLNNGTSLNRDMMVGPRLQPELRHIIMRWRCHPICLVADIVKMYRQVKVAEEDVDFQRLLWRKDLNSELQHLRLLRVTFGTSSAPYLAVRALQQLAHDEVDKYPIASNRVLNDFYVDDLITGCESVEEGVQIFKDMNELLSHGGFQLQKWSSNNTNLLQEIKEDKKDKKEILEMKVDSVMKILGLSWNRSNDEFQYTVQLPSLETPVTKRKVISDIARLFDPLGWIAPVIIIAKVFIQKIWMSGIGWDEELPPFLLRDWVDYRENLGKLVNFRLPRWIHSRNNNKIFELHGFSDASNVAYAAVVYARIVDEDGNIYTTLVTSKTKVCPIKQVSVPRLELCGAVLLARLLLEVAKVLVVPKQCIHAWTDSTVVLAWLSSHPSRWKTFIANRVSEILYLMDRNQWAHVSTSENPADCASRGVKPLEFNDLKIWKKGPDWLGYTTINYNQGIIGETTLEKKKSKVLCHITTEGIDIISRFSSLRRLIRVISYCRRFLNAINRVNTKAKITCWLTSKELNQSLLTCIRLCQGEGFLKEIESLQRLGKVSKSSKLTSLNPFLDGEGILRVGGRLQQANVVEEMKHPILIPHKSHLANLIVADAHERTIHGGPQLMLNYIRTQYWIVKAKGLIRQHVRKCIVCVRYSAQTNQQLMGQLPSARVTACRPFHQSGVDYAGPIAVRTTKGRGYHSTKGYICLFICMATRAIHLEVVSDLTSEAFLAAFKRFVARRGHCAELWSDNGTNFVGANKELKNALPREGSVVARDIASWLATNGTNWHFIPPHSPNFGGLWEAGVKSTKHHLKRVIGNSTLTFEEMTTLLCQIEACLNSRPITQISSNPEDPYPLTPGHFLVGEPLVLVPDFNYENTKINTLKRWHFTQRLVQDFWRRWSHEYLTQLQHRYKWSQITPEPKVGDIVLVKEDDLPPARWLYGIVTEKHTGVDKLTRVVSLSCKGHIIKRPVSKLIILPIAV